MCLCKDIQALYVDLCLHMCVYAFKEFLIGLEEGAKEIMSGESWWHAGFPHAIISRLEYICYNSTDGVRSAKVCDWLGLLTTHISSYSPFSMNLFVPTICLQTSACIRRIIFAWGMLPYLLLLSSAVNYSSSPAAFLFILRFFFTSKGWLRVWIHLIWELSKGQQQCLTGTVLIFLWFCSQQNV